MGRQRTKSLGIILLGLFLGCHKSEERASHLREGYQTINLTRSVTDVMLPTELWDRMESIYQMSHTTGFGSAGKKSDHESEDSGKEKKVGLSAKVDVPTQYMSLKVYLTENDVAALGGKNYELIFGLGGGELDLKNFVGKGKKKFTLAVELEEPYDKNDKLKVFFLSNAKSVETSLLKWGAGCHKYLDITSYFKKTLSREGVTVHVADLRYLRVLGGTFFFVLNKNNLLYLAHLKVTDSRHKSIFCRAV